MSSRAGLRFLHAFRQAAGIQRPIASRRAYATASDNVAVPTQSRFSQFFNSEIGPKTVHFWAPIMKWGLVLAGASDFARPAENLSLTQNAALTATGAIWTRWCFVIRPKNLFLASVNFCLFLVGATQTTRVLLYHRSLKDDSMGDELKKAATMEGETLKRIVKDPKGAVEAVKNP